MHKADIYAAVRKSKYRFLSVLSKHCGVSEASLRASLRRPQQRAERAISRALGIPLHKIWPDRWSPRGERLVRRGKTQRRAS